MRNLLFIVLSVSAVMGLYSEGLSALSIDQKSIKSKKVDLASKHFKCDGRQYCSQMTSRAEAEFFIKNCPNTRMDGDKDGIPCENDSRF